MPKLKRPRGKATRPKRGSLETYRRKRDFKRTPEPKPKLASSRGGNSYLIQKHAARRLHYDFRLELDGVLLSWAVPNGPSLDPADRRLAVRTEDHPLDYGDFEGVIPAGQYGGGTVMLWDRGTWTPTKDPRAGLKRGQLEFELEGERLQGGWILARMRPKPREKGKENWLLIKRHDAHQRPGAGASLVEDELTSAASGRTMEQIAAERERVWSSTRGEITEAGARQRKAAPRRRALPAKVLRSAPSSKMPDFVPPQLATLISDPPPGAKWVHEIKFDGYRTQARIDRGKIRMLTRSGLDWTDKFAPIVRALKKLPVRSAIIDGEIVVQDASGVSSFADLQEALAEGQGSRLSYFVFDLLYLDGRDLTKLPLLDRKAALQALLPDGESDGPVRYSDHFRDEGPEFFRHACRLALEGTVTKRADAPYRSGRSRTWLKAKCTRRQEFVVGGWLSSTASGRDLRSLLIGYYDGSRFVYAGKIGTGFSASTSESLLKELKKAPRKSSPFAAVPKEVARGVRWVEPRVVVEAEFANWTHDRVVRHASFKGVRRDKAAKEIGLEIPIDEAPARASPRRTAPAYGGVTLTHPDRVLWPDDDFTKEMLAGYYASVSPLMLPHIVGRPLSLVRCPDGIKHQCFYQRHFGQGLPSAVKPVAVREEKEPYLAIEDETGLFSLIQFSAIEIHPWGARVEDAEHPDRIVMDFDPGEAVAWPQVIEAAVECRERLKRLGLESFVKTTGGKGLHVVVPVAREYGWAENKAFARGLASAMAADNARYTTTMAKSARKGRIFIDYLRNDRTSTAIAPYSTRSRPGAPIAVPLDWDELPSLPSARHYTLATIGRRLGAMRRDPWAGMVKIRQRLSARARRAVGLAD